MNRSTLLILLIAAALPAGAAEPVGARADRTPKTAPTVGAKPAPQATAKGRRTVSASASAFSSDMLAMPLPPGVLYPDLVPKGTNWMGSCGWNEAAGETCQSECPPSVINLPFGTKNIGNRPLNGPGTIKLFALSSGQLLKEWTFSGLAGQGTYMPGSIRRTHYWCGEGDNGPQGVHPPTHNLVVETPAAEANKNNNSGGMYVGPNAQLILQ